MNTRTYALVGVLLAILLWIYSLDEKTRALRSRSAVGGGAPALAMLANASDRGTAVTPTPPGWGGDPFDRRFRLGREPNSEPVSGARSSSRGSGLFLQGVMNGPRGRTALVNGEVVREGDRIAGREVLQIGARSVLVLDHGTVVTLSLKGEGS
ncbi:MAG: hypothetical protein AABZ94_04760 [Candidatus Eisenbacteria bacterium]